MNGGLSGSHPTNASTHSLIFIRKCFPHNSAWVMLEFITQLRRGLNAFSFSLQLSPNGLEWGIWHFSVGCAPPLSGDIFETGNVQDTPSQAIHVYGRRLQAVERQEIDADQCTLTLHLPHSSPSPAWQLFSKICMPSFFLLNGERAHAHQWLQIQMQNFSKEVENGNGVQTFLTKDADFWCQAQTFLWKNVHRKMQTIFGWSAKMRGVRCKNTWLPPYSGAW